MFRSTSNFDKLLEKATSNLRLEPDWPTILQICDLIRQGDVQPKYALGAVKKKLYNANPHSAMFGLLVLESCVKNCGHLIHDEVGTKQYMEQLRELVKTTTHDNVKSKVLELIQAWAYAFRHSPKYRAVQDTLNIMKTEGYKFPALKESDAMFSADTAPEWADGDVCHRCRVQFGMVQRKHHCRACGQVFCGQCSSKTSTLPKFGIEKEVRVCEACYDSINKPSTTAPKTETSDLPPEYVSSVLSQQSQAPPPRRSEEELREEEELQLALALSKSEAEHKEKEKKRTTSAIMSNAAAVRAKQYSPPPPTRSSPEPTEEDMDPELARYLNRSYWEKRQSEDRTKTGMSSPSPGSERDRRSPTGQQPSAPTTASSPPVQLASGTVAASNKLILNQKQENGETDSQIEEFVGGLKSQLEIFVNRMKSNSSRGRSIANDSSVQTLFMNITAMHSRLLRYIQQQDDSRVYFEGLQDKMAQVKDARAALDALREEHREKLRRQAEEAERLRQLQMAHKLEIMRKKKQEYLQYQRQLALQRIQEQEREMQMRQEQQKQQYLMGSMGTMPPGPMGYPMPPYMTPGMPQNYPPVGVDGQHPQFQMMGQGGPTGTFNSLPPGGGPTPMQYGQFPSSSALGGMAPQQGPSPGSMPMGPMMPSHMLGPRGSIPLPGAMPGLGMAPQGPAPQGPPQVPSQQGPPQGAPPQGPATQGPMQGPPPPAPGPPQVMPQGPGQAAPQVSQMAFSPPGAPPVGVPLGQGGPPGGPPPNQGPTPGSPQQSQTQLPPPQAGGNDGMQTEELIRFD